MAQSFLLFIPTKVSQLWFPESSRAVSTTILAMCEFRQVPLLAAFPSLLLIASYEPNCLWLGEYSSTIKFIQLIFFVACHRAITAVGEYIDSMTTS